MQRLMVLYSAEEFALDPTDALSFWHGMITRQCHHQQTLSVNLSSLFRNFTLHGIIPTSLELSIPLLIKNNSVMRTTVFNQIQHSPSPPQPLLDNDSLSHMISKFMSMTFPLTTSSPQESVLFHDVTPISLLRALANDIALYTQSVPEKSRVHFMPPPYANSSLEEYLHRSARQETRLLAALHWEDVLLLLRFMQRLVDRKCCTSDKKETLCVHVIIVTCFHWQKRNCGHIGRQHCGEIHRVFKLSGRDKHPQCQLHSQPGDSVVWRAVPPLLQQHGHCLPHLHQQADI